MNDVTAGLGSPRALLPGSGRPQPPSPLDLGGASRRTAGSHRAKRGTGSEATLTAPPPAPPSSKSRGEGALSSRSRQRLCSFLRTSSTRQPSRTCRPRRSHTNDVNPQQPRHVHKPPAHKGVMQPSAIGAGDDCCGRGRSRSSRALWRRAARQAAPGAHDGSPTGCDSRAHGVAVTASDPRIVGSAQPTAADRRPRARGVAPPRRTQWQKRRGDLSAPVHRRSSAIPRSYVNGIDARTLTRRRRRPRRPPPSSRTDR